jgi:WD40 repeat protein
MVNSKTSLNNQKQCIQFIYNEFLRQKHILSQTPSIVFQQIYNELQWQKGEIKELLEKERGSFLARGGTFLRQCRIPRMAESRLIMSLNEHSDRVMTCVFSPDGAMIASGGQDCTVRLWDVKNGKEIAVLARNSSAVNACAFSPDGEKIVSGFSDGMLKVWDVSSGGEIGKLTGHTGPVNSCSFSPDGLQIVSGSDDDTVRIWDALRGKTIATLAGHHGRVWACSFSPNGERIVSGHQDGTLKVWDTRSRNEILTFSRRTRVAMSCAFSHDGAKIVSGFGDGVLKVWDVRNGDEIATLVGHKEEFWPDGRPFLEACARSCSFSPAGTRIVSASSDRTLKIWDAQNGKEIATLTGHTGQVTSCAFSPNGAQILSGSYDRSLKLWDAEGGRESVTLSGHAKSITSCAFSPAGKLFATGGDDEVIKLWKSPDGQEIATLVHGVRVNCCAFSPDGKQIVSGSKGSKGQTLKLWNAESGELVRTFNAHMGWVECCSFSPDGQYIASGGADSTIRLWEVKFGVNILTFEGAAGAVYFCAFSPDGRYLVSGGQGILKLWDTQSGRRKALPNAVITRGQPAFMHDGKGGNEIASLKGYIKWVNFSSDGKKILLGSGDGILKLWDIAVILNNPQEDNAPCRDHLGFIIQRDMQSMNELATLTEHSVNSKAFSQDGKLLMSGIDGKTISLLNALSGKRIAEFHCNDSVGACAISHCGNFIACGDRSGNVYLLKLEGFKIDSLNILPTESEWR